MRNLKKFLALILAMMMAFSLMVSANAAVTKNATKDSNKYPDGNQVLDEFQVAVDVLTGMGVFHGNNGNFNAKNGIMRSEAVAVLYRLVTGDITDRQAELYAPLATQRFTDVQPGAWYAGYVGFAVDAGLVNGYNGAFMPNKQVTGYEMLKMLLKAVGYGKNGEFTGALWQINVGSTAQSAGVSANSRNILRNIEKTHYNNTLSLASAREVVAEMAFQVALNVPMVEYQYGWYNPYQGVPSAVSGQVNQLNPSLGRKVFGLTHSSNFIVLGNQDTGEKYTTVSKTTGTAGDYRWFTGTGANNTELFNVVTGLQMFGHRIDLYYSSSTNRDGAHPVYAYYDAATKFEVVSSDDDSTDPIDLTDTSDGLAKVAAGKGFYVDTTSGAVMNDFFGRGGSDWDYTDATAYGDGQPTTDMQDAANNDIVSPIGRYILISNDADTRNATRPTLELVIPLNIETSQITESNNVRGIETVAMPVNNGVDNGTVFGLPNARSIADGTNAPFFILDDSTQQPSTAANNVAMVNGVRTGIVAKAALTKTANESASALGDYVIGIHINGTNLNNDGTFARAVTSPNNVGTAEKNAINPGASAYETGYFLLNKATETTGKVVHYNGDDTVILEVNGQTKTLTKSDWYDTVVLTNSQSVAADVMPQYALPQSVAFMSDGNGGGEWVESYNNETYTFYLDYEGNYLGAKRGYSNDFFYGTYLDYRQELSTSKFEYFLTGVTIDGKVDTRVVTDFWSWETVQTVNDNVNKTDWRKVNKITSTKDVNVPYRDSNADNGLNSARPYIGFTYTNGVLDENLEAKVVNMTDYATNMERLDIYRAIKGTGSDATSTPDDYTGGSNGMASDITITSTDIKVGAIETETGSGLYLTDNTTFILVSGYGTDSLKPEIVKGISKLGAATIHLNVNDTTNAWKNGYPFAAQTYFKKGPSIFSQTGLPAQEVDTVILPKAAVDYEASSTTNSFYMGDPSYTLISANEGNPYYQYTVYDLDGNRTQIWLDKDPQSVAADTFLTVKETDKKSADGSMVYDATFHVALGTWGTGTTNWKSSPSSHVIDGNNAYGQTGTPSETVMYQPVNGAVATFTWLGSGESQLGTELLNVSKAKVTNLNATKPNGGIWPGVTDLASLNHAGSIYQTTGTPIRVAAVCQDGVNVTHIFVCWNQDPAT